MLQKDLFQQKFTTDQCQLMTNTEELWFENAYLTQRCMSYIWYVTKSSTEIFKYKCTCLNWQKSIGNKINDLITCTQLLLMWLSEL